MDGKQDTEKEKIVTTETLEKIEGTEIPEKYENKSKEDGKNGEKFDGKQDTEEEKIITTETPEKTEETEMLEKYEGQPSNKKEKNVTEESLAKNYQTQDPEKIEGYGVLRDVDNLLRIENLKIAESQEETDDQDRGRNLFEEIAKMERRLFL